MISLGFKNYLKSISLGNLSNIDDNSVEIEESPLSAHSLFYRSDKQNLSSINELKRELNQRLKDFSDVPNHVFEIECDLELPHDLPESNLAKIQGNVSKEIYQQQSAMWELLVTEQNFLKQIQFIVKVYISVFEGLTMDFFPKINVTDIFSNLKDVYRVSLEFWQRCMHPLVNNLASYEHSLQSHMLKDGFLKIGDILEPYILYCTEISKCRSYILSLEKSNELFSEYTKWAMEFEESNREMLCDHLAKPFQRLTKYKILLQAIQKYSSPLEKADIQEMIEAVDQFVTRVNEEVEEKTLSKKLHQLASQIDSYDVIDPLSDDLLVIVNQFNKFNITAPIHIGSRKIIRQLTHQGEIKLREGMSKTIDVRLYLFTDIILITKPKKKTFGKMKIIKSPLLLDKTRLQKTSNNSFVCISLNEFNCISSLYYFTNGDSKKVDEWLQKLEDAVKFYSALKLTVNESHCDFQSSIPKVKVVQSSPKQSRFKSQSKTEIDNVFEASFKHKSPVERKPQKPNQDNLASIGQESLSSPTRDRKGSQPTFLTSESVPLHRLPKSNSFHETEKLKKSDYITDVSGLGSILWSKTLKSTRDLDLYCQRYIDENGLNEDFDIIEENKAFKNQSFKDKIFRSGDILNLNLSKSLNKLNY